MFWFGSTLAMRGFHHDCLKVFVVLINGSSVLQVPGNWV